MSRRHVAASTVALLVLGCVASPSSPGASPSAREPAVATPKPSASAASAASPVSCEASEKRGRRSFFVGAWPESERAKLLTAMRTGNVAVKLSGCDVQVLPACQTKATIQAEPRVNCCSPRGVCGTDELEACDAGRELYVFSVADELASNFPREAQQLVAELHDGRALRVRAESNQVLRAVGNVSIGGAGCEGATHYLKQARLGGFELELAAADTWNAPLVRRIDGFGKPGTCGNGSAPNAPSCAQPFFVELAPLNGAGVTDTRAVERLGCVGSATPAVVGGNAPLELLRDHPDPALRLFATSGGEFGVCTTQCSGSAQRCEPQCQAGKRLSCVNLALALPEAAQARKLELLNEACQASNPYGCYQLGSLLDGGTLPQSAQPELARAAFNRGCGVGIDQWAGLACLKLAERYRVGSHGQGRSIERATEYYARACELGFGGCEELGVMALKGDGVPKDAVAGAERMRQACHLNSTSACLELGRLHVKGEGVPRDEALAISYLKLGCNGMDRRSCPDLQRLGVKVPARYKE